MTPDVIADYSTECNSTPHKRRRQTNQALEALGQLLRDPYTGDIDNKLNKNDILSLTLARLLRHKYWSSNLSNSKLTYINKMARHRFYPLRKHRISI